MGAKSKSPIKGGAKDKKVLLGARDQKQDEIMKETCWCCYAIYGGYGCANPVGAGGCCLAIGEVCCCAAQIESATCCDGDGCCAATFKCCCPVLHAECPPSNTPGIGCTPMLCGGNVPRDNPPEDGEEKEEYDMLNTTCWCLFLYCFGFGCNSPGGSDPCCMVEGKLCCIWASVETDTCCDDGYIEETSKCCCCVADASCPAGRTPGCVICAITLCCENMPELTTGGSPDADQVGAGETA